MRWLEACQSPVWDTALALIALLDAGVPAADPAVRRGTDWLLGEEIRVGGDWSVRRPRLAPGGWAFEFANDLYPDVDDTAEVVLALRRAAAGHPEPARVHAAADRGVGLGGGDGQQRRRLGRVRRGQHPRADPHAAVLRLRCGDRPAVGGRHRAHGRDAGASTPGVPRDRGIDWLLSRAGAGRLLVRPVGRQPRVRHRCRGAGPGRGGHPGARAGDPPGGALAGASTRTRTAAGARTSARTPTRGGSGAAPRPRRRPRGRCWRWSRPGR